MLRFPRTWIEVNLGALQNNLALLRECLAPGVRLALVVKADAYGHGLVPVPAFALHHGADWVAVATVQEGVTLRESGVEAPIVVISPILPDEAEDAVFYGLRVLVEQAETAASLGAAAVRQRSLAKVHLEIDTGLARFGCRAPDAVELATQIRAMRNVRLEGLSTHFANSSGDPEGTERQMAAFRRELTACREKGIHFEIVHLANSAATVNFPSSHGSLVRVGIAAYGIDPYGLFDDRRQAVLTWKARIMALRVVPAGAPISYSGTYRTPHAARIATLGVGYGDGYPRNLSNRGFAFLNGHRVPVVGLVNMDQMMVDVTGVSAELGDAAEIVGPNIGVPEIARLAETNPHEIVCRIMPRVPRHYIYPAG